MARYTKDKNRVLATDRNYLIPLNAAEEGSSSVTIVQFKKGHDFGFIKRELIKTLKAIGCIKADAIKYIKVAFPEVYNGKQ